MARKVLVVFYSRSGTTRRAAETLARQLHADIEEIHDTHDREGLPGILRSAIEGLLGLPTQLEGVRRNPSKYDLVVIGTPIWISSLSSPVRTYLMQEKGHLKQVAFFTTQRGPRSQRVFEQMASLAGVRPLGTLALKEVHVRQGLDPLLDFVEQLWAEPVRRLRIHRQPAEEAHVPLHH